MRVRQPIYQWIFAACGVWLIGLGLYFIGLRPALLPEDPEYIGATLSEIRTAVPGLERWLRRVFTVMGGFMTGAGVLTLFVALSAVAKRESGVSAALAVTGLFTVVLMSAINFVIDSDFKWLLLVPALLWSIGTVGMFFERPIRV